VLVLGLQTFHDMNGRRRRPHERIKRWPSSVAERATRLKGRDRISFEVRSQVFRDMLGEFEVLAESDCETLNAHEAAIFLEHGVRVGDPAFDDGPTVIFTTQPYCGDDRYYLVDIKALNVNTRAVKVLHTSRNLANGGTLGMDGRLYFCFQGAKVADSISDGDGEFHLRAGISSVDPRDWESSWRVEVDAWQNRVFNSPNDVVMTRSGSLFFTDPSYAAAQQYAPPAQLGDWVWRFDPRDKCVSVVADNFSRPNGLALSPDESTLYVTDTGFTVGDGTTDVSKPRSVYAFDLLCEESATGTTRQILANRRLLYVSDSGVPDGLKVDARGFLYAGCADGVHVVDPATGCLLGKILIAGDDGGAANLCFGRGASFASTLFVLAESAIVALHFRNTHGAPVGREAPP